MLEVNSTFEKTINGLFEISLGDLPRFGATLARHKSGAYGLLAKYYAFSVSSETDEKVLNAAVRRALQHKKYKDITPGVIRGVIASGFNSK